MCSGRDKVWSSLRECFMHGGLFCFVYLYKYINYVNNEKRLTGFKIMKFLLFFRISNLKNGDD